jgi:hypothetical protein
MEMSQSRAPVFPISFMESVELATQANLPHHRSGPTVDSVAQLFVRVIDIRQDRKHHLEFGFKILPANGAVWPGSLMHRFEDDQMPWGKLPRAPFQVHWRHSDYG